MQGFQVLPFASRSKLLLLQLLLLSVVGQVCQFSSNKVVVVLIYNYFRLTATLKADHFQED
jgi:hypothetical protein